MHGEDTNPGFPALDAPRREPPSRTWLYVLGFIAAAGAAGNTLIQWINIPFETKTDAQAAHQKLQESIDTMREEHRQGDERLLEAINKLGDRLGGKRK
jgi:hypothetical protein